MDVQLIRNFSIIAHIDHGKSTLADSLLMHTGALDLRQKKDQFLDSMDLERERGITIKAQTVRLNYELSKKKYQLNLIDTPGHVDFSYEVSRSLKSCEGALLVVDASQGIQAQTLANTYLALENNLEIIPVLNKIDLPTAQIDQVKSQIHQVIGLDPEKSILVSAKAQIGMNELLEAIIQRIPSPKDLKQEKLRALIFDSWFESYQGVIMLCRIFEGSLKVKDEIKLMATGKTYEVLKMGVFSPFPTYLNELFSGEVGFVICGIKDIKDVLIGDTLTHSLKKEEALKPLKGFKKQKPLVFSGLFPVDSSDFKALTEALDKLALNDSSFTYEKEKSQALGFGFRCGFLGLLHMEVVRERLEREFFLNLISTAPSVVYQIKTKDLKEMEIDNPTSLPDPSQIEEFKEPFCRITIHLPTEFLGSVLKLCQDRRGIQVKMEYMNQTRVILEYELPLNEMVLDFYDQLKSITKGYASMDYEFLDYRDSKLVKMDLLLNGEVIDALSLIVHRQKAEFLGRNLAIKLKDLIPKQQYQIAIQAAIGSKVIARETISALRKDVTAKCYGGDITRKRKLLEKQKRGKKKMKQIGQINLPQEAFLAILKTDKK